MTSRRPVPIPIQWDIRTSLEDTASVSFQTHDIDETGTTFQDLQRHCYAHHLRFLHLWSDLFEREFERRNRIGAAK